MSPNVIPRAALSSVLAFLLTTFAAAQDTMPNVSPELGHRIEAMLRSKVEFPPASSISFGAPSASEIPGYDRLEVHFRSSLSGDGGNISLLVSKDGTRMAQFSSYDIAVDPKLKFPSGDRPARGGPVNAPVQIVLYDDLECPFCARLHAELFPALTDRYKDQVRIVYRSFPIQGHPWAMHAAIDTDCLGAQSAPAYWTSVDAIHAHAAEYGGTQHSLAKALQEIDVEVKQQGHTFHVDEATLNACIAKQDTAAEDASVRLGEELGVMKTPTIFINGVKIAGAVPLPFFFEMADNALKASGQIPPPYEAKPAATPSAPPAASGKP